MDVVNMCDVLKEQEEMETEAHAVLGGSDPKNCAYFKGYIRQALYSCLTCLPESKTDPTKRAGVCLACSLHCHESHELIELYTKRHFRCDCGGHRMPRAKCSLAPIKTIPNRENKYNQNFSGVYCVCHRPYPDPEDDIEDEMIQCVVCEDWYHRRHLNGALPTASDYSELICGDCMDDNPFLSCYLHLEVSYVDAVTPTSDDMSVDSQCIKPPPKVRNTGTAAFWSDNWRQQLCRCNACTDLYKSLKVEFLIDPEDPVQKYEEAGLGKKGIYEESLQAFSTLDHTKQVDMIMHYNELKGKLQGFLQNFASANKVVTAGDIQEFFHNMKNNTECSSP